MKHQNALRLAALLALAPAFAFAEADHAPAEPAKAVDAAPAENLDWVTDFESAKAEAAKSGKDLLVDFTGSDWCGWCIRLRKEVFDLPAFKPASKDFVFVELDFPHQKTLPEALKKQNEALQEKFGVTGFPTILLLDASGVPYAQTGYQPGGPEAYLKHLAELRATKVENAKKIAAAEKLEGDAKAAALAEIAKSYDPAIRVHQVALMQALKAADPEDKQGVVLESSVNGLAVEARNAFQASGKIEDALSVFDKFIASHKLRPETLQKISIDRFSPYAYSLQLAVKDKKDNGQLKKLQGSLIAELDRIIAIAPETENAPRIKSMRARLDARLQKMNEAKPVEKPAGE